MLTLYNLPFKSLIDTLDSTLDYQPTKNSSILYSLSKDDDNYYLDICTPGVSKSNVEIEAASSSITISTKSNYEENNTITHKEINTKNSSKKTYLSSTLSNSTPSKLLIPLSYKINVELITSSYNAELNIISLTIPFLRSPPSVKISV